MKRTMLAALIVGLLGSNAFAADAITAVTDLKATVGSTIAVTGKTTFAPGERTLVGEDGTGDQAIKVAAPTGTDLKQAFITAKSPTAVDFELVINDLRDGGTPEVINYNWPVKVGETSYELNATAQGTGAELTCGVVFACTGGNVGGKRFSLNVCAPDPQTGQNTCAVNAVPGEITATSVIWHITTTTATALAGGDVVIEPDGNIASSYSLSGVLWNTGGTGGDTMGQDSEFIFPAGKVSLGLAPAGTPLADVVLGTTVKVKNNLTFTGSLAKPAAGSYILVGQAASGGAPSERVSIPVTVA